MIQEYIERITALYDMPDLQIDTDTAFEMCDIADPMLVGDFFSKFAVDVKKPESLQEIMDDPSLQVIQYMLVTSAKNNETTIAQSYLNLTVPRGLEALTRKVVIDYKAKHLQTYTAKRQGPVPLGWRLYYTVLSFGIADPDTIRDMHLHRMEEEYQENREILDQMTGDFAETVLLAYFRSLSDRNLSFELDPSGKNILLVMETAAPQ